MPWPLSLSPLSLPLSQNSYYKPLVFYLMEEPYSCHNLSLSPTPTNSTTTSSSKPAPRLDYHNLSLSPTPTNSTTTSSSKSAPRLDYDVVDILAAMMCALGLNSMLQCVVRCTRRTIAEPAGWVASRRLNAGLKREHVVALPVSTFSAATPSLPVGCPICLSDLSDGDKIRVLPACGHRFHVGCIDTWLLSHCSCPTCRNRLPAAAAPGLEAPLEIMTTA